MSRLPDVHLDFETFSEQDIRKVGGHRYAEDTSTDIVLTGYAIGDEKPIVISDPRSPKLERLFNHISRGARIKAHNAQFEMEIWNQVGVPVYNWPKVPITQFRCTAAQVAALALPRSLDMAAFALKSKKRKIQLPKGVMDMFSKPQKDGSRIRLEDRPEEAKIYREYNGVDIEAERDVDYLAPKLSADEVAVWHLDCKINRRGVPVDIPLAKRAVEFVEEISDRLTKACVKITGYKPTQRDKILAWFNERGARIRELTEPVLTELLKKEKDPVLLEVARLRLEAGRAGVKKLMTMIECASYDDRVRGTLLYHAASTGRWSSLRVQLHNLPKGKYDDQMKVLAAIEDGTVSDYLDLFDKPLTMLSKSIRGFIKAQRGKLFCADYSAIEARVLAWMARERWLVDAFAKGMDPYVVMASKIYGRTVTKADEAERFIGKQTVLGCGYQMGPDKFRARLKQLGVEVSLEFAQKAVKAYRDEVPLIVQSWYDIERAAVRAVDEGTIEEAFMCRFYTKDRFLHIELPSGRCLYYLDPVCEDVQTPWGQTKRLLTFMTEWRGQLMPETTYGGKLCENIVQAVSRDIMANGMQEAEDDGFPVILTVHDEVISECREGDVKDLERALCRRPWWADKRLPIAAEGKALVRYGKT